MILRFTSPINNCTTTAARATANRKPKHHSNQTIIIINNNNKSELYREHHCEELCGLLARDKRAPLRTRAESP